MSDNINLFSVMLFYIKTISARYIIIWKQNILLAFLYNYLYKLMILYLKTEG